MTTQEAIAQISALMIQLIERVKDGKTAGLIQQIQSANQTIQAGYFASEQKSLEMQQKAFETDRKMREMENQHAEAIAALKGAHRQEIARLTAGNARSIDDELKKETVEILRTFFHSGRELSEEEISRHFNMPKGIVSYHLDTLWKKKFISGFGRIIIGGFGEGSGGQSPQYEITAAGRKYIVENGLAG